MEKNTTTTSLFETYGLTPADLEAIHHRGLSTQEAVWQFEQYVQGVPHTVLERPAHVGDGIDSYSEDQMRQFAEVFDAQKDEFLLTKFVPASGAATRMFKFLLAFLNDFNPQTDTINGYINKTDAAALTTFLTGKEKFPFYTRVRALLKTQLTAEEMRQSDTFNYHFIRLLTQPDGLDYANKPKGVLEFHRYRDRVATAVEEQLCEAALYAASNGKARIHFTVSPAHRNLFEQCVSEVRPSVEQQTGVHIKVDYSYQDPATDTLAVNPNNSPFRDGSGKVLFRPGGHGSLIRNLNALDADLAFIKNIDNVIQNNVETIALYKKGLAGLLLDVQQKTFSLLRQLDENPSDRTLIEPCKTLLEASLNTPLSEDFELFSAENKLQHLKKLLNRPMRVCGMVKNEGEPGGGPFWVLDRKGNTTLQIVEGSQIGSKNKEQQELFKKSTHFNPVDLVCSLKDYRGQRFDLTQFVDYKTGFIVHKTNEGRHLKSYEHPGLWNGAMAKWLTIFVEVPLLTFNPVKTVNDLLKPAHQPAPNE